jgi:hypothetical protein
MLADITYRKSQYKFQSSHCGYLLLAALPDQEDCEDDQILDVLSHGVPKNLQVVA